MQKPRTVQRGAEVRIKRGNNYRVLRASLRHCMSASLRCYQIQLDFTFASPAATMADRFRRPLRAIVLLLALSHALAGVIPPGTPTGMFLGQIYCSRLLFCADEHFALMKYGSLFGLHSTSKAASQPARQESYFAYIHALKDILRGPRDLHVIALPRAPAKLFARCHNCGLQALLSRHVSKYL